MCAKKEPVKSRTDPRLYWPKRCLSLCKAVCPRWREGVALDAGQCHMLAGWSITTSCCNCPSTRTVSCTQHNNAAQIVAVKQIWYSYCMSFLFFNHCHKMCIFVCFAENVNLYLVSLAYRLRVIIFIDDWGLHSYVPCYMCCHLSTINSLY